MACQSCLDKRRALLGAVGLKSLQAKVPLTVRDLMVQRLSRHIPVKSLPVNVGASASYKRYVLDIAIQSHKVGILVGYQNLSAEKTAELISGVARVGWVVLDFTPEYLSSNMDHAVDAVLNYL